MRAVQRSVLCRSRRELSNEYLVAKIGFDTAENEPCEVCPLSEMSLAWTKCALGGRSFAFDRGPRRCADRDRQPEGDLGGHAAGLQTRNSGEIEEMSKSKAIFFFTE